MGQKNAKLTAQAAELAESLVEKLAPLGDITSRKMFGGYGIFVSGKMFAMVSSQGVAHLKVDGTNVERFEHAGAEKFGRMPYYEIPPAVLKNTRSLRSWAKTSTAIVST